MRIGNVFAIFAVTALVIFVGATTLSASTETLNEEFEGPSYALVDWDDEAVVVNFTVDCRTDRCDLTYDKRILVEFHAREESGGLEYITWVSFYRDRGADVELSKDTEYVLELRNNRLFGDESPVIGSFTPTRNGSVILEPNGSDLTLRAYYGGFGEREDDDA